MSNNYLIFLQIYLFFEILRDNLPIFRFFCESNTH